MAEAATAHGRRLARLREALAGEGLGVCVVAASADLTYLLGIPVPIPTRLTALVVPADGAATLLTPALEAADLGPHVGELVDVRPWRDGEDPVAPLAALVGPGSEPVGIADRLWARDLLPLIAGLEGRPMRLASATLARLRAIKDEQEIAALAEANAAIAAVIDELATTAWIGRSERDIAAGIGAAIEREHDEATFAIVAAGEAAANPHHVPSERVVAPGDVVLADIGGRRAGYCSDVTRMFVAGDPSPRLLELHAVLQAAHAAARRAAAPGTPAQAVDAAAREVIADAGYGAAFIHRLGHGIGLDEHEAPYLVAGNEAPLLAGMAFSIEPGIYLPGDVGLRLEDIVVLEDDGVRELTPTSPEIRVVG